MALQAGAHDPHDHHDDDGRPDHDDDGGADVDDLERTDDGRPDDDGGVAIDLDPAPVDRRTDDAAGDHECPEHDDCQLVHVKHRRTGWWFELHQHRSGRTIAVRHNGTAYGHDAAAPAGV